MRDYAELVKALRCCSKIDARNNGCDSCPYEYCGDDCQNLCGRAADAIEELLGQHEADAKEIEWLKKCVQDLPKQPRWISVEERLPEGNGTRYEYDLEESNLVLVYGINHIGEMAYGLGRYIYDHDDPKDSGWNGNMDCDYDLDYCTVTHWMPLPAPPKEENAHD